MEKIKLEIEVSKEVHEVGEALKEMILVTKKALEDGFQLDKDLGPLLTVAVAKLPPAIDGLNKVSAEIKEDPQAVAMALAYHLAGVIVALKGQPEAAPQA